VAGTGENESWGPPHPGDQRGEYVDPAWQAGQPDAGQASGLLYGDGDGQAAYAQPAYPAQGYETAAYQAPVYDAPVYQAPLYEQPYGQPYGQPQPSYDHSPQAYGESYAQAAGEAYGQVYAQAGQTYGQAAEYASGPAASYPAQPEPTAVDAAYTSEPQAGVLTADPATAGTGEDARAAVPEQRVVLQEGLAPAGAYARATTEPDARPDDITLHELLQGMLDAGASDLHLTAGSPALVRVNGELAPLNDCPVLPPDLIQRLIYTVLTQKQRERFEQDLELDFAYAMPGAARFRVNVYRQRENVGAAFRRIPYEIKTLDDLGVPESVSTFAGLPRGMVLVTGPTGSGKSTTLASLIDLANRTRRDHIMTVEDPIEFLHRHKNCMVNQREVGEDTHSFSSALKHVLRQDPDIILVGEMRDLETISVALTAAETGHLVFATLHTQDAAQTIDRVIDVFPPHQQQQVRAQLAGALQGVVCQTLCRTTDGKGRVVATEVMVATPAIRNLIREGKTHQVYSAMQAGAQHGMHTMDQHLAELVRAGKITYEHGVEKCHHVEDFNRLAGRNPGGLR
jgi:twitching motility protein PilT